MTTRASRACQVCEAWKQKIESMTCFPACGSCRLSLSRWFLFSSGFMSCPWFFPNCCKTCLIVHSVCFQLRDGTTAKLLAWHWPPLKQRKHWETRPSKLSPEANLTRKGDTCQRPDWSQQIILIPFRHMNARKKQEDLTCINQDFNHINTTSTERTKTSGASCKGDFAPHKKTNLKFWLQTLTGCWEIRTKSGEASLKAAKHNHQWTTKTKPTLNHKPLGCQPEGEQSGSYSAKQKVPDNRTWKWSALLWKFTLSKDRSSAITMAQSAQAWHEIMNCPSSTLPQPKNFISMDVTGYFALWLWAF